MPNLAEFAKFILYADDANITLTANTIEEIGVQLETLISNLKKMGEFQWIGTQFEKN